MRSRQFYAALGGGAVALALLVSPSSSQAVSGTTDRLQRAEGVKAHSDSLPDAKAEAQAKLRQTAMHQLINGKAKIVYRGGERVIQVSGGTSRTKGVHGAQLAAPKYVQYPTERTESVFTVLADFSDTIHPVVGGDPGPVHNEIPEPDRVMDGGETDDNSTYWEPDFNRAHYMDLMFGAGESFKNFYKKQSNGRFKATGDVSDWVTLPYNEARYGSNNFSETSTYWPFVRDTATAWYNAQVAAGKTPAQIKAYLAQFDKLDRYDYDGDGNFNEPDGYIDHFQAIHAGEGEEAGGGAQGADAIWSHRWAAYTNLEGQAGPTGNLAGGVQIGDTGVWIRDYTTEPENGGLGVFAHEFGHDLGLPDLYDTAGGDNGTGFWTLMSGGSWMNHGGDAIGTTPAYMGPWEKLQLGWLNYKVAETGKKRLYDLGPADRASNSVPQAIIVPLPDQTVVTDYNTPHSGQYEWWSGSRNGLNVSLSRPIDLTGATTASVSSQLWLDSEEDYDFLYAEVSTDGGSTWTTLDTLTGSAPDWAEHSWDLSAYAGQQITFRFRFQSDGGVNYTNAFVDDIKVTVDGSDVFTDDVESGNNGWATDGWTRMTGSTSRIAPRYYLAENRVYGGYDRTLRQGPYNFGWGNTQPNRVERFPYQNGMLVWYYNEAYADNNTSEHPGFGQVLPVDARPTPLVFSDGAMLGNRRQPFDATFGLERTQKVTFHRNGNPLAVPSRPALPAFNDTYVDTYWDAANPMGSVKVAGTGTIIRVKSTSNSGDTMEVWVDARPIGS